MELVQILGIPDADAEDLGLVWEIEEANGNRLSFKLYFTNPIDVSQGDTSDYVFVLLNLEQFKDAHGNSLGDNLLVKVLLPRQI